MYNPEKWDIPPEFKRRMHGLARDLRQHATPAETILWQAIRKQTARRAQVPPSSSNRRVCSGLPLRVRAPCH